MNQKSNNGGAFVAVFMLIFILGGIIGFSALAATSSTSSNQSSSKSSSSTVFKTSSERTATETKTEKISFETKTVDDDTLEYGKTVTRSEGSYGEKTYTYSVTYKDNKETSRELIKEEVTKQPVAKIIARGTKIVWHCVDATSYDKNPYNDNKCTSSTGEIRYVPDSTARLLDPSYSPGQKGNPYYNRF